MTFALMCGESARVCGESALAARPGLMKVNTLIGKCGARAQGHARPRMNGLAPADRPGLNPPGSQDEAH
jgi:hypothetical protein